MRALVLTGGNIKGAFQAGAVRGILDAGYRPEIITGISVGAAAQGRSALDIGWRALTRQWAGLVDMERLYQLVRRTISTEDFIDPPVRAAFGAVSLPAPSYRVLETPRRRLG